MNISQNSNVELRTWECQRDDKIDLRIELGKMWTFQFWHPTCQRGVAKEEKSSKFGKTKWSCQRGIKGPQFGKTKWSWQKHEKWTWQNREIIAVWTSEFGKKWSCQKWKTELGQIPDQAFRLHCKHPSPGHHPLDETCLLWLSCGWTLTELIISSFTLVTHFDAAGLLIGR